MKKFKILLILLVVFGLTGCFKRDELEDATIYATAYPIEYIINRLYGENSKISSIYPDGIIIDDYDFTDKQIKDFSKGSIVIYNGLTKEKDYVTTMLSENKDLKIIDASKSIEYNNSVEEVWLNPSHFLMMAQNIKTGLHEYIENHYLLEQIDSKYDEMYIEVSNLDAKISLLVESANNKTIIVTDDLFKFLEKYGITVISLDPDTVNEKVINQVNKLINDDIVKYIFARQHEELSDTVNKIVTDKKIEVLTINTLSSISSDDRTSKKDYISLMNDNIELFKKELIH